MDGLMMDFPLTLDLVLRRAETIHAEREVVTCMPDKTWHSYTYGQMVERAKCLAVALQRIGIRAGDRVATLCWNHYRHLEAYFGVPVGGAVLHTLNLRLHADELAHIVNEAEDKALIVDESLLHVWQAIENKVQIEHLIVVRESGEVPQGALDYEQLLSEAVGEEFVAPVLHEQQAAAMCYTSGTVGRSKGVVYSHRALCLHTLAGGLTSGFEIREEDAVLPVVPMFHVNAWGLPFSAALIGAKLVFPGPHLDAASLLSAFDTQRVTVTAGVPTIWIAILAELDKNPDAYDLTSLRKLVVGGAALPESLIRAYQERHRLNLLHAWGMTELTPIGTFGYLRHDQQGQPPERQFAHRSRQGTPVPLVEIRARNEAGFVPWDGKAMGELEVRGPWVAQAYYKRPDAADRFTDDGWFRTGDVVSIDQRGSIKIEDRIKDLIKSGGEWIGSLELENVLMMHPAVSEVAVIGVPHEKWGERPLAVVVANGQVSAEELRTFMEPKVAKWWLPDAFEFVDAIPRTSVGKYKKAELRAQFSQKK